MKKIVLMTALSGVFLLCACGENPQESISSSEPDVTVTTSVSETATVTVTVTDIPEVTEIQTETEISSDTTISETTVSQTQTQTTTVQTAETFPEPENQPFETDENGAVIMEVEENTDDSELISAGQELYENACKTEFRYHVGCPYNLDYNNYIENQYGWPYYLVTDEGYTSIADVEKDYYKIYAEERGNELS